MSKVVKYSLNLSDNIMYDVKRKLLFFHQNCLFKTWLSLLQRQSFSNDIT